jgi:hypothetical protein
MPDVEDSLYGEGEPLCSGQVGQPELRVTAVLEFLSNLWGLGTE